MIGFKKSRFSARRQPKIDGAVVRNRSVFSYHNRRSSSKRLPRSIDRLNYENNQRQPLWHKLPSYFVMAAICVSVVYLSGLDINNPKIVAIDTRSDSSLLRSKDTYQKYAKKFLKSSFFNRSKITVNTGDFSQKMKTYFPELSEVSVTLPLAGRRPIVELAAVRPKLILKSSGNKEFIIDKTGQAIMNTKDANGIENLNLPVVTDQNNTKVETGKRTLTISNVAFITTVAEQLRVQRLKESSITLPPLAQELHVRISGEQYFIKFNMMGDARLQSGAYLAAKDKLALDHVTPAEYIDVRIEDRVYYK